MKTRLGMAVLAVVLGASACGGSGSDTAADIANEQPAVTDAPTTAPPATASPSTEAVETTVAVSTDAAAYCAFDGQGFLIEDLSSDAPPAEVEAAYNQALDGLRALEGNVPAEIADDVSLATETFDALVKVLVSNGWDQTAIEDESVIGFMTDPAVTAAFDALDDFADENCESDDGIDDESADPFNGALGADDLEAILGTEVGRQAFIDSFMTSSGLDEAQAVCFIDSTSLEQMAFFAAQDMDNVDIASFLETLDSCGIPLDALS